MIRHAHKKPAPETDDVTFEPVSSERELLVEVLLRRIVELERQLVAARNLSERSIQ